MIKAKNTNLLLALVCFLFTNIALAQSDIILKTTGEEMKGKVLKMGESTIQFVYENETIEYTVKKSDIVKITFSSGRVEFFNKLNTKSNNYNLEDHHNKVAILPFGYLKDQQTSNATMQKKIQQETFSIFKRKSASLKFQDPNTTNALLAKAGINNNNIAGYTMGEIANILGVEYLVQGMVSIEKTTVTSYSNTNTTTKRNGNNSLRVDRHGHIIGDIWNSNKRKTNSSTFGTTQQNYATNITMNIYNDKGENIFTKDHQSFWQTPNAYKITLGFLAKRTPIYKR
ncbi:hypothetical protein [Polaribacter sp. MED152]|uniref:hypothetical protein n=1 Tax=Polaribacter sp. MED152 TaxID=313598 RepID=UPI000186F3EC|nr:hypothetical protein [Polaribacter sp. MED152]EAQ41474.2 hypothetical protein MED152_02130 [Polaribacter sp. MED152]